MGASRVAADDTALTAALERAATVRDACEATATWLAGDGTLMPSIYIERGGRLRCVAVRGYWQVFDGMLPGVGVIGHTFLTGEPTVVGDTERSGQYLEVAPGVCGEACAPLRSGGRVIGAVNVESESRLDAHVPEVLGRATDLLGRRIDALGGLERESRSQRLARHASRIASLQRAEDIRSEVLLAACDLADMESALLVGPGTGDPAVWGPHSDAVKALAPEMLAQLCGWVESMTSVYTVGEPSGSGFEGHEDLRRAGVESFVALPVHAAGGAESVLLLMHRRPVTLPTEDVELLELLAAQAASALQTADAMAELHDRATRDPLTHVAHKATFRTALRSACDEQLPLSLLIVDVDCFKDVNDSLGHAAGDELLVRCAGVLEDGLRGADRLFRIGGDEFAVMVDAASAPEAAALAERLRGAMAALGGPTVSVGVATRQADDTDETLFARADEALYAAKHQGRNAVVAG